ncbi:MAG: hypothetical protein QXX17_00380, partial [Conexivisphaerales archaeon]
FLCTSATDGNIGFPSNLPGGSNPQIVPSVPTGTVYMCIELILNSQSPDTTYTIHVSGSTITSNTETCTTDSSGNADCSMVFTLDVSPGCSTNPIFISPKVSGAVSTSNQIHHIVNLGYPDCVSVPEFPLGPAMAFAIAVPALIFFRKRLFPN